jgi:hypothetical protein
METKDRGNPPRQSTAISTETSRRINIKTRDRDRALSAKVIGPAGPY